MGFPLNLLDKDTLLGARGHMIGGSSGLMTGLAASAIVASVRNASASELEVSQITMSFFTTTFATVLSGVSFAAYKVEGFTASPTSGRAVAPVPMRKRTEDHPVLAAVEVVIANTAALVAGTPAAPAVDDPWHVLPCNAALVVNAIAYQGQTLWEPKHQALSLRADEGLMFLCQAAFPTSLVGRFTIGLEVHRP